MTKKYCYCCKREILWGSLFCHLCYPSLSKDHALYRDVIMNLKVEIAKELPGGWQTKNMDTISQIAYAVPWELIQERVQKVKDIKHAQGIQKIVSKLETQIESLEDLYIKVNKKAMPERQVSAAHMQYQKLIDLEKYYSDKEEKQRSKGFTI